MGSPRSRSAHITSFRRLAEPPYGSARREGGLPRGSARVRAFSKIYEVKLWKVLKSPAQGRVLTRGIAYRLLLNELTGSDRHQHHKKGRELPEARPGPSRTTAWPGGRQEGLRSDGESTMRAYYPRTTVFVVVRRNTTAVCRVGLTHSSKRPNQLTANCLRLHAACIALARTNGTGEGRV